MASLSTSVRPSRVLVSGPQWPWSVYSQKQTSVMTSSSGAWRLMSRMASWTIPESSEAAEPRGVLVGGDAEQKDAGDLEVDDLRDHLAQAVERELVLAGHRGDLALEVAAVVDEQGVDEVVDRQPMLADEVAEPGVGPESAGAPDRESGGVERHRARLGAFAIVGCPVAFSLASGRGGRRACRQDSGLRTED